MANDKTEIDKITERIWEGITKHFGGNRGEIISESAIFQLTDNGTFIVSVDISLPEFPYIKVNQEGQRHALVIPYNLIEGFVKNPVIALKFGGEGNEPVATLALENPSWNTIEHFLDHIRYCDVRCKPEHFTEVAGRINNRYLLDRRVGTIYFNYAKDEIRIYFLNDYYHLKGEIFDCVSDIDEDVYVEH